MKETNQTIFVYICLPVLQQELHIRRFPFDGKDLQQGGALDVTSRQLWNISRSIVHGGWRLLEVTFLALPNKFLVPVFPTSTSLFASSDQEPLPPLFRLRPSLKGCDPQESRRHVPA